MKNFTSFAALPFAAANDQQSNCAGPGLEQIWEQQRERLVLLTNFMEALRARLLAHNGSPPIVLAAGVNEFTAASAQMGPGGQLDEAH